MDATLRPLLRNIALPLTALVVLVIGGLLETSYQRSHHALTVLQERAVARSQLQTLMRRMSDAESAQRGYFITGIKSYLQPYGDAVKDADQSLAWLTSYYAADASLQAGMKAVAHQAVLKRSELETSLSLYESGRPGQWHELVMTGIGRDSMVSMNESAMALLGEESRRVTSDREGIFQTLGVMRWGIYVMLAGGLVGMVLLLRKTVALDDAQKRHTELLMHERDALEMQVRHRTAELTDLARHLDSAREDERKRLARELHDELGALLTAAKLDVTRLKRSLGELPAEAVDRMKHLNGTIDDGIKLKRRIIEDLHPSSLSNLGLESALQILTNEFAQRSEVNMHAEVEPVALSDSGEITVYRLVQEALTNIAKYAQATEVSVQLREDAGRVHVAVADNGRGFDTQAQRHSAHGLVGMRYRVEVEGGKLTVVSAPGQGTRIEAWLPTHDETAVPGDDIDVANAPQATPQA